MKLLHIDSSVLGSNSVSRQLSADVVAAWRQTQPELEISYRDLAEAQPEHLSLAAFGNPAELPAEAAANATLTQTLLAEFQAADALVIGAPMYNFSVPSQLKAWVDRIAQAGKTFHYTDKGPVGLAGGKQVVIVSTRGGIYSQGPAQAMDFQESYLKAALGFLGITDVRVVRAEALNMGPEPRAQGLAQAQSQIAELFAA